MLSTNYRHELATRPIHGQTDVFKRLTETSCSGMKQTVAGKEFHALISQNAKKF